MMKMEKMMLLVIRIWYGIILDSFWFQSTCHCQDLKFISVEDNYGLHFTIIVKEQSFLMFFI